MLMQICAMFDSAVGAFGQPIFVPATQVAVRSFGDEVNRNDAGNGMFGHSDDYVLYHLGVYDNDSGALRSFEKPIVLVRGKDVKQ